MRGSTTIAEEGRAGEPLATRWLVNLILLIATAIQLGRIFQVEANTGETPFLSANDRSRWCTIATLAVNGRYEIDDVLEIRDEKTRRRTWYTIDLVRHRGADGKQHFYSSKPPLLPTMLAGVYAAIRAVTGATLMNNAFVVARVMLVLVNLIPLLAFWWLMLRWVEREVKDNWAVIVLAFLVAFGTYLSTFLNTLNNHLPAAIAVGGSLWCIDRIVLRGDRRLVWFALCGVCTSFGAANELPALSWVCAAGAILATVDWKKAAFVYGASLLPVAIAFFGCNYLAHGEWVPPYAHRSAGVQLFELKIPDVDAMEQVDASEVARMLREQGAECSENCMIKPARRYGTWALFDPESQIRYALKPHAAVDVNGLSISVHEWGDWYDYEGSYWVSGRKQGVDKGEPNRAAYVFHCLLGHHGIFSLTPFWLVSVAGCWCVFRGRESLNVLRDHRLLIVCAIAATSIIVLLFYFARGLEDRNYGGVSSGFRWTFWLIPLWIWLAVQGMNQVKTAAARRFVEILLVLSVFSASYPWRNPWTSPWLMQLGEYLGWI